MKEVLQHLPLRERPVSLSQRELTRSLRSLASQGISDVVINDLVKHVRKVYGFVPPMPMGIEGIDKAREELGKARKIKAIGWAGIRSEEATREHQIGFGKIYTRGVLGERDSSRKIGRIKRGGNEGIKNPVQEAKSRAGLINLMIELQLDVSLNLKKLEGVFKKANKEGWDMRGKELVDAIKKLIPKVYVDEKTERAIREAVIFADRSINLSYRGQRSVGAKMLSSEYP